MEDINSGKNRKRLREGKRGVNRQRFKSVKSSKKAGTRMMECFGNTEKTYEKQIPRSNITQGRITTRQGLFLQGKCTSFVQRANCVSPTKRARMDEDLHRIIQLANGVPVEDSKYRYRPKMVESCFGKHTQSCIRTESMKSCEDSCIVNENCRQGNIQDHPKVENQFLSMLSKKLIHSTPPNHGKMLIDEEKGGSGEKRQIYMVQSASNSSNDTASCPTDEDPSPTLVEYEEFTAAVVLPLSTKKVPQFTGRDYLKEVRERIKAIAHPKNVTEAGCLANTTSTSSQETRLPSQRECSNFGDLFLSSSPPVVGKTAENDVPVSPARNQHNFDDFSPFSYILSPKTTILNPIEYLKRVEQSNRQRETVFDSGHETGQSHGSSLANSQGKQVFSQSLHKSCDISLNAMEVDECCVPSKHMGDSLLYQHSNRSFIDSPQAFKVRDGNFMISDCQSAYAIINPQCSQKNLDVNLKHSLTDHRIPSELNTERDIPGLQYLMNISEIGHSKVSRDNPYDLLDELDALDCDVVDSSTVSARDKGIVVETNKWGLPPSPPTPEHKFYRRKMF